MKVALSESFKSFFVKHKIIEFSSFLDKKERGILSDLLQTKQGAPKTRLFPPDVAKALFKTKLGQVSSFLFKKRPLRLAWLETSFSSLPEGSTLEQISSASPILGGVFLCLSSPNTPSEETLPSLDRQVEGHAIFFTPDHPIPFQTLAKEPGLTTVLLCLAPQKVRYILQPLDPHTHDLKKEGYAFGDALQEETAPYLYY